MTVIYRHQEGYNFSGFLETRFSTAVHLTPMDECLFTWGFYLDNLTLSFHRNLWTRSFSTGLFRTMDQIYWGTVVRLPKILYKMLHTVEHTHNLGDYELWSSLWILEGRMFSILDFYMILNILCHIKYVFEHVKEFNILFFGQKVKDSLQENL